MDKEKTKYNNGCIIKQPRSGCSDVWNAFMVKGASYTMASDMPMCPCTTSTIPKRLISYDDAKTIYNKETKLGNNSFTVDAYIHFYLDDYKFDGKQSSIWLYPQKALDIIKHFEGIITPDFSTYVDFPDPIKRFNTYRMRAFGYWIAGNGIHVINNVRWGTIETWDYCFDGIPVNSIVSIGTVGGGPRKNINRKRFELGLFKMMEVLKPYTILVYGSAKGKCFDLLREKGITVVSFQSKTAKVFEGRRHHE